MEFQPITIQDKKLFDEYYQIYHSINSEENFTSMFIWQTYFGVQYALEDGFLILSLEHENFGRAFHFPIGHGDATKVLQALQAEYGKGKPLQICPMTSSTQALLEESTGDFTMEHRRDMDDYVYRTKDLIELKGKKYHAKRNHLNYFQSTYDYTYHTITQESIPRCYQAVCKWIRERNDDPEEELDAMEKLFENYEALGVVGAYLEADGRIIGVTVGEEHHGAALIHVEKCDTDYRGVYVAINQMFLEHEFSHLEYVNREEDMGSEGIRKAKLSYHPAFLIEKHSAWIGSDAKWK